MAGVHAGGTGGGVAADRSSFVGNRVPEEICKMINSLNNVIIDKATFRAIVAGTQDISCNSVNSRTANDRQFVLRIISYVNFTEYSENRL